MNDHRDAYTYLHHNGDGGGGGGGGAVMRSAQIMSVVCAMKMKWTSLTDELFMD